MCLARLSSSPLSATLQSSSWPDLLPHSVLCLVQLSCFALLLISPSEAALHLRSVLFCRHIWARPKHFSFLMLIRISLMGRSLFSSILQIWCYENHWMLIDAVSLTGESICADWVTQVCWQCCLGREFSLNTPHKINFTVLCQTEDVGWTWDTHLLCSFPPNLTALHSTHTLQKVKYCDNQWILLPNKY